MLSKLVFLLIMAASGVRPEDEDEDRVSLLKHQVVHVQDVLATHGFLGSANGTEFEHGSKNQGGNTGIFDDAWKEIEEFMSIQDMGGSSKPRMRVTHKSVPADSLVTTGGVLTMLGLIGDFFSLLAGPAGAWIAAPAGSAAALTLQFVMGGAGVVDAGVSVADDAISLSNDKTNVMGECFRTFKNFGMVLNYAGMLTGLVATITGGPLAGFVTGSFTVINHLLEAITLTVCGKDDYAEEVGNTQIEKGATFKEWFRSKNEELKALPPKHRTEFSLGEGSEGIRSSTSEDADAFMGTIKAGYRLATNEEFKKLALDEDQSKAVQNEPELAQLFASSAYT